ncbi:MAG: hypothetical protein WBG90_10660 [Saonia sp.]
MSSISRRFKMTDVYILGIVLLASLVWYIKGYMDKKKASIKKKKDLKPIDADESSSKLF